MAGRIPQNFIDDLVSRADIVEVVNARVPLKKKGREYSACCPFHNEKTPSFTVSEIKQFYHCFGCGAHGTALGFMMEYENLDFVDAVEALAAEYNIDVPRENTGFSRNNSNETSRDDKEALYDIIKKASELYQQELKTSDRAIQYLKERGLTGDIAKTYKLGYIPEGWNFLTDKLGNASETLASLKSTGLLVTSENGKTYDRFRDRIIFPITDKRGRVIGFGGRVIDNGEPKYLNSPENIVFHKGLELYGLYEARLAVRNLERLMIVEGYMDVVALAQHGIGYAVASLGTATTKEQIQKTLRTVPEVIFCYDGDSAGLKAAWRALENSLPIIRDGHIVKFLFLPEKEDPDSLVRKIGKEEFEKLLTESTPLSEFLFDHICSEVNINTDEGKAALQKRAMPLLSSIPESVFKDLLYKKLSTLIGLSVDQLGKKEVSANKPVANQSQKRSGRQVQLTATRTAIALLLQYPKLVQVTEIPESFNEAPTPGFSLLFKLHRMIISNNDISSAGLLERWRDLEDFSALQKLMQQDIQISEEPDELAHVYKDAVTRLIEQHGDTRFEVLQNKISEGGSGSLSAEELEEYKRHIGS